MMGTKARLFTPVSAVSLDALVPADHFYRHLDRVLDLSFVRDLVQECYVADKGRPSVDPMRINFSAGGRRIVGAEKRKHFWQDWGT
jgi:hypothetical protein